MNSFIYIGMLFGISITLSKITVLEKELARTNKKLDKIMDNMGIEKENENEIVLSEEIDREVRQLIIENKLVKAVKLVKDETLVDLVKAKEYVDNIYEMDKVK